MALSNAERQRRFRLRLKQAADIVAALERAARTAPVVFTEAGNSEHVGSRPLVEIKVHARCEWQAQALRNEPTTAEEAQRRYYAIRWETGEIERRYAVLKKAEGQVLEDARRFFPSKQEWKAWLASMRTCSATTAAVNDALWHVGYRPDGRPGRPRPSC
jgi:hypothetical protein